MVKYEYGMYGRVWYTMVGYMVQRGMVRYSLFNFSEVWHRMVRYGKSMVGY